MAMHNNNLKSAMSSHRIQAGSRWLSTLALTAIISFMLSGCASQSAQKAVKSRSGDFINKSASLPYLGLPKPQSVEDAISNGDLAFRSADFNRALFEYVRALDLDDKNLNAYLKIGATHNKLKNYAIANMAYTAALQLDTENIDALENIAVFLLKNNRSDQARYYANKAIINATALADVNADSVVFPVSAYTTMGIIYDLEDNPDKALEHYFQILDKNPRNLSIHNNIAYSYYLAGSWIEAEKHYQKAISLDSSYALAWKNLGLLYIRQQRYSEALAAFEQVGTKAQAYNDLGYICLVENQFYEAEFFLQKAIDLSPNYYKTAYENLEIVQWKSNLAKQEKITNPSSNNQQNAVSEHENNAPATSIKPEKLY